MDRDQQRVQRRLARIQLLLPLSLLVLIASAAVGALIPHPSIREISDDYLTIFTPSSQLIGIYWGVIALLLIGQSLVLSLSRNASTQKLAVNGVGVRLSLVNILMSAWVLFWCLRLFLVAEIIVFVALALAWSMVGTLLLYKPERPTIIEALFLQAPVKLIAIVLFSVDWQQNGLLALSWYKYIGADKDHVGHGKWERDHAVHTWGAFGCVLGTAILNAMIVFAFADLTWAIGSIYIAIALAVVHQGKPPQVYITLILGAVLIGVSLLASYGWIMIKKDSQRGQIRLEEDEEEDNEPAAAPIAS